MKSIILDEQGQSFLLRREACEEGRNYVLENYHTMDEAFQKCDNAFWIIWAITRCGVLTDQELRLFAVFCARQNIDKLKDPRSLRAIDIAQRFAYGLATDTELLQARMDAHEAVYAHNTDYDATRAYATRAAAYAAYAAAYAAACDAAAYAAAYAAACDARATRAACDARATRAAQLNYLRSNTKPNWDAGDNK